MEQRKVHKARELSKERIDALVDIGFRWGESRKITKEDAWNLRLEELKAYKEKNGHCNVHSREGELGRWVHRQRQVHKGHKLSKERIDALKEIGFGLF